MDTNFWHKKWKNNEIGFHKSEANPILVAYFKELSLAKNSRVFIPLCGKTRDIAWLLSEGYRVAGVELSGIAIRQLFADLGVDPVVSDLGKFTHFYAKNIDIFVGDIFDLSSKIVGAIDAIYDRAALVALPEEMRLRYAAHLTDISRKSPQLLLGYEYDQALMEGPPFSVDNEEVRRLYGENYDPILVASSNIPESFKAKFPTNENVWLLR